MQVRAECTEPAKELLAAMETAASAAVAAAASAPAGRAGCWIWALCLLQVLASHRCMRLCGGRGRRGPRAGGAAALRGCKLRPRSWGLGFRGLIVGSAACNQRGPGRLALCKQRAPGRPALCTSRGRTRSESASGGSASGRRVRSCIAWVARQPGAGRPLRALRHSGHDRQRGDALLPTIPSAQRAPQCWALSQCALLEG